MNDTVYSLIERSAEQHPNQTAITYITQLSPEIKDLNHSYTELLANINRTARLLREAMDDHRGVVSFLLPSTPETQFILWAAETVGIANPINPLLNEDALRSLLKKAETEVIFALGPNPVSDIWEKIQAIAPDLPRLKKIYSVGFAAGDGVPHYETELSSYDSSPLPAEWLPTASDICAYFHTGGTTGTPKLAMHSHHNQVASINAVNQGMQSQPGEIRLNGLPQFHVAGSLVLSLASFAAGSQILLPTMGGLRNPEVVQQCWKLVEHYGINIMGGIPTSMGAFAQVPVNGADLNSLSFLMTGGAMVPPAVVSALEAMTDKPVYQVYGMTETAGSIALSDVTRPPTPGAAGIPNAGLEVRIDNNGQPADCTGEICVRGNNVFEGYLGHSESALEDGWLRTGDLGHIKDGEIFITGRAKDLIIRSGHNIDPAVIENALEKHPAVAIAAAVGKPDHYAGELPVAFVELKTGASATPEELREFAMAQIDERPACPKSVTLVEEMPKTAVGKIHKPTLRISSTVEAVSEALLGYPLTAETEVRGEMSLAGELKLMVSTSAMTDDVEAACKEIAAQLNLNISLA